MCVGGFYSLPEPAEAVAGWCPNSRPPSRKCRELTLFLAEKLEYPELDTRLRVRRALPGQRIPHEPRPHRIQQGLGASTRRTICERHRGAPRAHSTALHAAIKGRGPYMVGPLARLNLNAEKLHPRAAELLPKVCKAVRQGLALAQQLPEPARPRPSRRCMPWHWP